MKRTIKCGLLPVLLLALLCGCGASGQGDGQTQAEENYPVIEQADLSALTLAEAANDEVRVQYPAEDWVLDEDTELLAFYEADTLESDFAVNVNIQKLSACDSDLTDEDLSGLLTDFEENYPYIAVEKCEMRSLGGRPAIYLQSSTEITDELIDDMIAATDWAEAWIEEVGGREVLLALPRTQNVYLYTVKDGWLYLYTGSYDEEGQIDTLISMMTVLDQTIESVG